MDGWLYKPELSIDCYRKLSRIVFSSEWRRYLKFKARERKKDPWITVHVSKTDEKKSLIDNPIVPRFQKNFQMICWGFFITSLREGLRNFRMRSNPSRITSCYRILHTVTPPNGGTKQVDYKRTVTHFPRIDDLFDQYNSKVLVASPRLRSSFPEIRSDAESEKKNIPE
ncbi:hypothetical protein Tco_1004883 [Tanacetum coccineum]|uniref:Uncharacterized protein n=1 Tax=Tanacetum coccineum TaxID=301880 RepID=A0ABQ5FEH7_9ASTR